MAWCQTSLNLPHQQKVALAVPSDIFTFRSLKHLNAQFLSFDCDPRHLLISGGWLLSEDWKRAEKRENGWFKGVPEEWQQLKPHGKLSKYANMSVFPLIWLLQLLFRLNWAKKKKQNTKKHTFHALFGYFCLFILYLSCKHICTNGKPANNFHCTVFASFIGMCQIKEVFSYLHLSAPPRIARQNSGCQAAREGMRWARDEEERAWEVWEVLEGLEEQMWKPKAGVLPAAMGSSAAVTLPGLEEGLQQRSGGASSEVSVQQSAAGRWEDAVQSSFFTV